MLGVQAKSPKRKSLEPNGKAARKSLGTELLDNIENLTYNHHNLPKSPKNLKLKQVCKSPLIGENPGLPLEVLGRTPQSQKKNAEKKRQAQEELRRQTANIEGFNDLLGLNDSCQFSELGDSTETNFVTQHNFSEQQPGKRDVGFDRRSTFDGNIGSILDDSVDNTFNSAMDTSDLIRFSPVNDNSVNLPVSPAAPALKKTSTPNRRETADFNAIGDILGDLEGEHQELSVNMTNSISSPSVVVSEEKSKKKKSSTPNRRETADFTDMTGLLNDLSGEQSVDMSTMSEITSTISIPVTHSSPVISPTTDALRALKFSQDVMSGRKSIKRTASKSTEPSPASRRKRRNSTGSVASAMSETELSAPVSPVVTPQKSSRLASPSPRRSPRFSHSVDNHNDTDLTMSSNNSSLFAGFEQRDDRRNTCDMDDMQAILDDLTTGFSPEKSMQEEVVESHDANAAAATVTERALEQSTSTLNVSAVSTGSDMFNLFSPKGKAKSAKKGRKSVGVTSQSKNDTRRETVDAGDLASLMNHLDNEDATGSGFKQSHGRRSTVDPSSMQDLFTDLENDHTGSVSSDATDVTNTLGLTSTSPGEAMSLTQERVQQHNAKTSSRSNKKGRKSISKDDVTSSVTVTGTDSLVVSDTTGPVVTTSARRVTIDGTDIAQLDMFLMQEEESYFNDNDNDDNAAARRRTIDGTSLEALNMFLESSVMDGNASVVANDNSVFNDTVSVLSNTEAMSMLSAYNTDAECGTADNISEEAEQDDEHSVDDNATVDANLLDMSSDTLQSFCTVGTYDLQNNVEAILNDSELLNTSDMTCGTVGSLGGWLAAAEELVEQQNQSEMMASQQSEVDTSNIADSLFSPAGKKSKTKRLSIKSKSTSGTKGKRLSGSKSNSSFAEQEHDKENCIDSVDSPPQSGKRSRLQLTKSPRPQAKRAATMSPQASSSVVVGTGLKSCLSVSKYPRNLNASVTADISFTLPPASARKNVIFGSPKVAEFNKFSPTTNMTPLDRKQAKTMFSMQSDSDHELTTSIHSVATVPDNEEEDEITSANDRQLEEWDRLTNASGGSDDCILSPTGSPTMSEQDLSHDSNFSFKGSSSKKQRRRSSKLQPAIDISNGSDDSIELTSQSYFQESNTQIFAPTDLDRSAFSDCTHTQALPDDMNALLNECGANDADESIGAIPVYLGADVSQDSQTMEVECDLGSLMNNLMYETTRTRRQSCNHSQSSNEEAPQSLMEISRSHAYGDDSANISTSSDDFGGLSSLLPAKEVTVGTAPDAAHEEELSVQDDESAGESLRLSVSGIEPEDNTIAILQRHASMQMDTSDLTADQTACLENNLNELFEGLAEDSVDPVASNVSLMSQDQTNDDNTAAILQRHASMRMDMSDMSSDHTACLENNLNDLCEGLVEESVVEPVSSVKATKSSRKRTRQSVGNNTSISHRVDNEVSFIVRNTTVANEMNDSVHSVETDVSVATEEVEVTKEEVSAFFTHEEVNDSVDISTATTLVDENSHHLHDISVIIERENVASMVNNRQSISQFDTSFDYMQSGSQSNNTSVLKSSQESMLSRLQSLNGQARVNKLAQCATPAGKRRQSVQPQNSRISIGKSQLPMTEVKTAAVEEKSKRARMSLGPESGPFTRSGSAENVVINAIPVSVPVVHSVVKPPAVSQMTVTDDVDVSVDMNNDTIELDAPIDEETAVATREYSAADMTLFKAKLRDSLTRYFQVVQKLKMSTSTRSSQVQALITSIMQNSMREHHLQCNVSMHVDYDTLDKVWDLTEDECESFVSEQVDASLQSALKSSQGLDEEHDTYSMRIPNWETYWLNVSSVSILEHVDILRESQPVSVGVVTNSTLLNDQKFFSKALATPAKTMTAAATARKTKLLASTLQKTVVSNDVSTAIIAAQRTESRETSERNLARTRRMISATNQFTFCRVVVLQSSCIQINACLSNTTHAVLKFKMVNNNRTLTVEQISIDLSPLPTSMMSPKDVTNDAFVRGYFASVLCCDAACGPMSETSLDHIKSPSDIPALLQKISSSIATLRLALVHLNTFHGHASYDVTIRKLPRMHAEHEVVLTLAPGGKHVAVMTLRKFVSLSKSDGFAKDARFSSNLWDIQTSRGEMVSMDKAAKIYVQMLTF